LTCTEENFIFKSGFQRYAAEHNVCVVGPDTSPRNVNIEGVDEYFNLGYGAGFYVDACTPKWEKHFRMYSYVTSELIQVVESNFDFIKPNTRSIFGHSMGGHGALICSLKNPGLYRCVSAFAPLVNPINSNFSQLPYTEYLGPYKETWKEWDATYLVQNYSGPDLHLLIDQVRRSASFSVSLSLSFFNVTKDLSFNFDHSDHKKIFVEITWFSFFLKSELVTNCKPEKKSQIRLKVRKVRGL
jgi:esterase D, putative